MRRYEYKVVPAPRRGEKAKGVKTTDQRFALALSNLMNTLGAEGWDYLRSDTLQVEEKSGWARRATVVEQSVLVFRREIAAAAEAPAYGLAPREAAARPLFPREAASAGFVESVPLGSERADTRFAASRDDQAETGAPRLGPARGQ